MNTSSSIAIVGAGLSGLTAAYRLQQQGIHAEVYEARDRPGGRVFTYYTDSSYEELGAKFLGDGGEAIHIKALMNELGINAKEQFISYKRKYYQNGQANEYYDLFKNAPPPTEEMYQAVQAKAQNSKNILEVLNWFFIDSPELLRLYKLYLTNYEGTAPEYLGTYCVDIFWNFYKEAYETSKKYQFEDEYYPLESIEGGGSSLISAICNQLVKPIHYNAPVKKISRSSSGQIALDFEDGQSALFDQVVLTIPCTIFRDIEVEKGLIPEDQMDGILTLQYGTVGKILLRIKTNEKLDTFAISLDSVLWTNADQTILTVYSGGDGGVFDPSHTQSYAKKIQEAIKIIHILYPSVEIIGEAIPLCWTLDKFSKGSYSNFGVDQFEKFNQIIESHGESVKNIFRPIEDKIFFAGEHTALKYYATMEGAVESGERIARIILKTTRSERGLK